MSSIAPLPMLRWLAPLGLLLAEYLLISLQFDALPLLESAGLSHGFGHLGILAPLLIVVATVAYILAGDELKRELALRMAEPVPPLQVGALVLANIAAYAGLLWLTTRLFGLVALRQDVPVGWLVAWLGLALVTAASLAFVVLPPRAAGWLARNSREFLLIAAGAGALAWLAGVASGTLWDLLRKLTLDTVFFMLEPFTDDIGYAPEDAIIGVGEFFVVVAPECSGLEGIGLIVVVLSVYVWSARQRLRMPRALWLVPIGVALVWFGNALRIALLIAVGVHLSPDVALSGFHSKAGWLFFCAIALALIGFAERSPAWSREPADRSVARDWNPTATYLAPQLALIGTSLATALFAVGLLDRWYGLRIAAVLLVLYWQRQHLPKPTWPPSWHAPAIGIAAFALWLFLIPARSQEDVAFFRSELASLSPLAAAGWIALRVVGSVVTVPIAEELAFRAYLLRRIIDSDFLAVSKTQLTAVSVAVSSLAFGLLHAQDWLAATLCGAGYAFAQSIRGRTSDAVVAHAVTNGLIAVAVLGWEQDWLWV